MKKTLLAKITRPNLSGIFVRERLFRLLDRGRQNPVVWVAAQAGSGKTTLAASYLDSRKLPYLWYRMDEGDGDIASFFYYMGLAAKQAAPRRKKSLPLLTPEYLGGVPAFTRRYFEKLFRCLKPPFILVLDNYQEAPLASGFHDMLVQGLDAAPEGSAILVLSRIEPPPQFARLYANNRLQLIGWDDIRFTGEESEALLKTRGPGNASREMAELLHKKTGGWAAGLVLLMAGAGSVDPGGACSQPLSSSSLFDYFTSEIFNKTDSTTRMVLLKTSCLRNISCNIAIKLTGLSSAGPILERLYSANYFTQKYGTTYEYHPLFREFLQTRAKEIFTDNELAELRKSGARLLEEAGQAEEAAAALMAAEEWPGALRLLLAQASQLVSQGRSKTLDEALRAIPASHSDNNAWVLYWSGICRMYRDPYEGRDLLVRAFYLFKAEKERTGLFLSWTRIGETIFFAWGESRKPWILELEKILAEDASYPSQEIEMQVTLQVFIAAMSGILSKNSEWEKKVTGLVFHSPVQALRIQMGHFLMVYHLWIGDFSKAEAILRALKRPDTKEEDSPSLHLTWYAMQAMCAWWAADRETCLSAVQKGLSLSEATGVHFMDAYLYKYGVSAAVSLGSPEVAVTLMRSMAARPRVNLMNKAFFHYLSALVAWHRGDARSAVEDGALALAIVDPLDHRIPRFCVQLMQTIAAFDAGQRDVAADLLARTWATARGGNFFEFVTGLFSSHFSFLQGREEEGLELLRKALAIGAVQGYFNFAYWRPEMMSGLCAKALAHSLEPDYVRAMIRKRGLVPEQPEECWPYQLKIYTLGRFEVWKEYQILELAGRKKQVELLKALVAFGGTAIPEERVTGLLWPDAEGDDAHNSFKMTLSRLRTALGSEAVLIDEGAYTLNPRLIYCDVWAFSRSYETASSLWKQGLTSKDKIDEAIKATEKALALYRGTFMPGDTGLAWTVSLRERLRGKLFSLIVSAGQYYEEKGKWKTAKEFYQKGIEADRLREKFYQRLMVCHHKLGQNGQAIAVYDSCCAELSSSLGIQPSLETESLLSSIQQ